MCLQVRSASSGPRQRDSSRTLENSSLGGEEDKERKQHRLRHAVPTEMEQRGGAYTQKLLDSCKNGVSTCMTQGKQWQRGPRIPKCPARPMALLVSPPGRHDETICGSGDIHQSGNFIQNTGILLRACFFFFLRTKPNYLQDFKNLLKVNLDSFPKFHRRCDSCVINLDLFTKAHS